MKPLCIYHGNCADGFTAAWVVNFFYAGEVDFHAGVYGQPPPDVTGRDVILVDFSYKRPVLDQMVAVARQVIVLDHHKTAQADLADVLPPDESDPTLPGGQKFAAVFDMGRSGAQITWDYLFAGESRPKLVDYVGDRDLWRFALPQSRELNAHISSFEYDFEVWTSLVRAFDDEEALLRMAFAGAAIERKHHKDIAELVKVTRRSMVIGGFTLPVASLPHTMSSDAGHLMASANEAYGAAACYWDTPAGRVFSLRSTETGIDVSDIAKKYGGDGHAHAAGFTMAIGWEGDDHHS